MDALFAAAARLAGRANAMHAGYLANNNSAGTTIVVGKGAQEAGGSPALGSEWPMKGKPS